MDLTEEIAAIRAEHAEYRSSSEIRVARLRLYCRGTFAAQIILRDHGNDKEEKTLSLFEVALAIPVFAADEAIFSFDGFISINPLFVNNPAEDPAAQRSFSVIYLTENGAQAHAFPFTVADGDLFAAWDDTENQVLENYRGPVATAVVPALATAARPYLYSILLKTLEGKGHQIQIAESLGTTVTGMIEREHD